jgi:hypothetical protein
MNIEGKSRNPVSKRTETGFLVTEAGFILL